MKLLESNNNDVVTIEGIEDVDISDGIDTKAIQCKYYVKTEYNHSVIAKPIRWMFKDYMNRIPKKKFIKYMLYGKYQSGHNKLKLPIDIKFLKENILSFKEEGILHHLYEEYKATDEQLDKFISLLEINIYAEDFDELENKVINKLCKQFSCSQIEAELYYYNNALRLVKALATQESVTNRKITRKDFIEKINNKEMLFEKWFLQFKGENEFCKKIKTEYFTKTNISPASRFFLVECDTSITDIDIVKVINKIGKNWSKLSKREKSPFCPYVFLQGIDADRLVKIKKLLWKQGTGLCDGYDFLGADFCAQSLTRNPNLQNGEKIKIISEIEQVKATLEIAKLKKEIYLFYLDKPYFKSDRAEINMIQIQTTKSIEKMV
ncbi:MAG: hypothetical protein MSA89_09080 [Clostridium sp.]|nr:hypothetical protein [Clostridium sp.]MCI7443219.1 hypothetical protein [Clostridium sp.]